MSPRCEWLASAGEAVAASVMTHNRAARHPIAVSITVAAAVVAVATLAAGGRMAQAPLDLRARLQLDGTQLDLRGSGATDADVHALRAEDFPRVKSALAAGTQIGDAGVEALARLPLAELDLARTPVTDTGLAMLSGLRLERLDLTGTRVTDAGLASLKGMPLHSLVLRETATVGKGLDVIAGLDLRVLDLSRTKVDDGSMEALTRAKRIVTLDLTNTPVTDRAVERFDRISGLSTLVLTGTAIGPDAIAGLKRRHPELRVMTAMPMR
jgi:Leucine Rich repeat